MSSMPSGSLKRTSSNTAINDRSTKRQLAITMETVPDDFNDDDHKAMDKQIIDSMRGDDYNSSIHYQAFLLLYIVDASGGRLDNQYANGIKARDLIEANPSLKEVLDDAWRSRSFRAVRNLSLWT